MNGSSGVLFISGTGWVSLWLVRKAAAVKRAPISLFWFEPPVIEWMAQWPCLGSLLNGVLIPVRFEWFVTLCFGFLDRLWKDRVTRPFDVGLLCILKVVGSAVECRVHISDSSYESCLFASNDNFMPALDAAGFLHWVTSWPFYLSE